VVDRSDGAVYVVGTADVIQFNGSPDFRSWVTASAGLSADAVYTIIVRSSSRSSKASPVNGGSPTSELGNRLVAVRCSRTLWRVRRVAKASLPLACCDLAP
jgi:hypothetical protein